MSSTCYEGVKKVLSNQFGISWRLETWASRSEPYGAKSLLSNYSSCSPQTSVVQQDAAARFTVTLQKRFVGDTTFCQHRRDNEAIMTELMWKCASAKTFCSTLALSAACDGRRTYRTAAPAGTLQPCRSPLAFGGRVSGWRAGGRGGYERRPGSSRPRSFHRPSRCGRRRWWRSCHSRCQWPSSCHLTEPSGRSQSGLCRDNLCVCVCVCVCVCAPEEAYLRWTGSWPVPGSSWTSCRGFLGRARSTEQPCQHTRPRTWKSSRDEISHTSEQNLKPSLLLDLFKWQTPTRTEWLCPWRRRPWSRRLQQCTQQRCCPAGTNPQDPSSAERTTSLHTAGSNAEVKMIHKLYFYCFYNVVGRRRSGSLKITSYLVFVILNVWIKLPEGFALIRIYSVHTEWTRRTKTQNFKCKTKYLYIQTWIKSTKQSISWFRRPLQLHH